MSTVLSRLLWKRPAIHLNVKVEDRVCKVPPPEQVNHQPSARLALQVYDGTVTPKAGHTMKITGSRSHLPLNNMDGMGSVPLPLDKRLHQDRAHQPLWQKMNNGLEACSTNISFHHLSEVPVPLSHMVSIAPTKVYGHSLQNGVW